MDTINEIREAEQRAEQIIADRGLLPGSGDLETVISDRIADLAIYAYERNLSIADLIVRGVAHAAATYMEHEEPQGAEAVLNELLFPFTGERQFADYIGEKAITLSGHAGRVSVPEWGA